MILTAEEKVLLRRLCNEERNRPAIDPLRAQLAGYIASACIISYAMNGTEWDAEIVVDMADSIIAELKKEQSR